MTKKIIIEDGKQPIFIGNVTVGEALRLLQQASLWVESLNIPETKIEVKDNLKEE